MSKEAVKQVISEFGSQARAAVVLGTGQQLMANWIRQGYIPFKHLQSIALTTKVPIKDLIKPDYLAVHEWLKGQENAV